MYHNNTVITFTSYFQAVCSCGWSSTLGEFEEIDLLRAMHAHAVKTFRAYQID
ncbi:MAG: hypothetical protein ACO3XJ_00075 [Candidatus Nanopelagicales bacterium]